jgi:hypothetical protein
MPNDDVADRLGRGEMFLHMRDCRHPSFLF